MMEILTKTKIEPRKWRRCKCTSWDGEEATTAKFACLQQDSHCNGEEIVTIVFFISCLETMLCSVLSVTITLENY